MGGSSPPLNSTSTTGPITWAIFPTWITVFLLKTKSFTAEIAENAEINSKKV
jgi:hypothetical protein